MPPRVVTVVQARCGSSRLPGKVLCEILGQPVLARQLARVRAARHIGTLVVAIPTGSADDALAALCAELDVACYRGDEHDLLDRHLQAARAYDGEVVVKIPSDCPLIGPEVIDDVLGAYLADPARYDYVSNLHPATYPDGNDVEVMRFAALATAWREARRPLEREHTTPFLWENPERFRLGNVVWPGGRDFALSHRFTLDYPADLAFVTAVYERLLPRQPLFSLADILALLDEEPQLLALNARYAGVNWYRHHLHELSTVSAAETRQAPNEETP